MVDLNKFMPKGSKWVLNAAHKITDLGFICGIARNGAYNHAYLLKPL